MPAKPEIKRNGKRRAVRYPEKIFLPVSTEMHRRLKADAAKYQRSIPGQIRFELEQGKS